MSHNIKKNETVNWNQFLPTFYMNLIVTLYGKMYMYLNIICLNIKYYCDTKTYESQGNL